MNIQAIIQQIMRFNSNPMINNLIQMAQSNNVDGLMDFGRNVYRESGRGDFDKDLAAFAKQFGSK